MIVKSSFNLRFKLYLVGGLVQRVLLEVELLEAAGDEEGVEVHVRHVVVAGEDGGEGGQLRQHLPIRGGYWVT